MKINLLSAQPPQNQIALQISMKRKSSPGGPFLLLEKVSLEQRMKVILNQDPAHEKEVHSPNAVKGNHGGPAPAGGIQLTFSPPSSGKNQFGGSGKIIETGNSFSIII